MATQNLPNQRRELVVALLGCEGAKIVEKRLPKAQLHLAGALFWFGVLRHHLSTGTDLLGARGWMLTVHELGPDAPPIVRPQIPTTDPALSDLLDLDAPLNRNRSCLIYPLADRLRANTKASRQGGVAPHHFRCDPNGHASDCKALLVAAQEALLTTLRPFDHQAMLPEGKALGHKIREALKTAGFSTADIQKKFQITRQAVNSWYKTGRIDINRLLEVIRLVQPHVPIGYWQDETIVELAHAGTRSPQREKPGRPAWPFKTDERAVCDLPPEQLRPIDAQLEYCVSQHALTGPANRARR